MTDAHNIFISWSKPQAKAAALALRDWLPRVIQASRPWMSEMDIQKGKPWLDELMGALAGLKLAIVCLTPEGLSEPWVLFEVGVICRALDPDTRIWTYLLGGLRQSDVPNPLGIFQHTVATKDDTVKLLRSINHAMAERAISDELLKDQFELRWKELDERLLALPVPSKPVDSTRSNEEMFSEIVEAIRAGAASGKTVEQLRDDVRGLRESVAQVMEILRPSGLFGAIGGGNLPPWLQPRLFDTGSSDAFHGKLSEMTGNLSALAKVLEDHPDLGAQIRAARDESTEKKKG
jgi:hypothetical protein